jgi:isoleucyl-tRNA synthetase
MRKAHEFEVTDRICLKISSDEAVHEAVSSFAEYIQSEVLACSIEVVKTTGETVDLNGHACTIAIRKA